MVLQKFKEKSWLKNHFNLGIVVRNEIYFTPIFASQLDFSAKIKSCYDVLL